MDIRMPGTDGLTATGDICGDPDLASTRILILTTFETNEYVASALRAGASGFLGKTASAHDLLAGIRTIAAGEALLSPQATRALIARFLAAPEPDRIPEAVGSLAELTAREREVMALAAEGHSNDEIAAMLYLSTHTIRTHVHRTMMKLHARDRAQLVVIAYQTGLVRPAEQPRPPVP
jgi:DNA-binding NarL/FixJ family response regulator